MNLPASDRNNMTPGESSLWKYVKGKQMMGYDFDRQRHIDEFIVDFYCKQLMLTIEIDGYSHDSEEAQERDLERQARLESLWDFCGLQSQMRGIRLKVF